MNADSIDDNKEFVCRVGSTGALPASRPPPVTDADVFNTAESDQESLGDSAAASDHICVDGDDDGNAPGDASPSKRARTASSSSYAEFISGTAASKECDSLEISYFSGTSNIFGRDAIIGNVYDIIREHAALILPEHSVYIRGRNSWTESQWRKYYIT